MEAVGGVKTLLAVVKDATTRIGDVKNDSVLPRSRVRRACLTALCNISADEHRCRALGELAPVCLEIARVSSGFDLEATREAVRILKNLAMALPAQMDWPQFVRVAERVIAGSIDGESCALVAATLRLAMRSANAATWRVLVDPALVVALLSVDIVRIHPFARVELARALASFLRATTILPATDKNAAGNHDNNEDDDSKLACLQTLQALKFMSFLLAAPQVELQLEALAAMETLPDALLRMACDPPMDIFQGLGLRARLLELAALGNDEIKSLDVVKAATKARAIERRMA